jgi:hypothetical protein
MSAIHLPSVILRFVRVKPDLPFAPRHPGTNSGQSRTTIMPEKLIRHRISFQDRPIYAKPIAMRQPLADKIDRLAGYACS